MEDEIPSQTKTPRQTNVETLSQEELLTKCKTLLGLLKKAKLAKDDAVADTEKLKCEQAKVIRELEEQRNDAEKKNETFQEIVANLNENKIVLVTKNESFQRQLNLQLNEVEALKRVEKSLLEERQTNQKENEVLKMTVAKQQKVVEQMKEERERKNKASSEGASESEKATLLDKIESLEAQLRQVDVLKNKFKLLVEEKKLDQEKLSEFHGKEKIFLEEKKAMEIITKELKCEKIILEEKFKASESENEKLQSKISSAECLAEKLKASGELVKKYENEREELNASQTDFKQKCEDSSQKIVQFEDQLKAEEQKYSALNALYNETKDNLESHVKANKDFELKVENLERECGNSQKSLEELVSKSSTEDSELKQNLDQLESENKRHSLTIQELEEDNTQLTDFYTAIIKILSTEEYPITKDNLINELHNLKTNVIETTSKYNSIKSPAFKLVGLVSEFFCLEDTEKEGDEDIVTDMNNTFQNLEAIITEFKNSEFETLCNKCSSDIQDFCEDVVKIKSLFSISDTNNLGLVNDSHVEVLLSPLSHLLSDVKEISIICSRLFSFKFNPDLTKNIDIAQTKTEVLGTLISSALNRGVKNEDELRQLRTSVEAYIETISKHESELNEKTQTIDSLEIDLKNLKQKFNEALQEKEETIQVAHQNSEALTLSLEGSQKEVLESKERVNELENQLKSHSKEATEGKLWQEKFISLETQFTDSIKCNESANARIEELQNELMSIKNELKEAEQCTENKTDQIAADLERTIGENDSLRQEFTSLQNELTESTNLNKSIRSECEKTREELDSVTRERESLREKLTVFEKETETASKSHKSLNEEHKKLEVEMNSVMKKDQLLTDQLSQLEKQLHESAKSKEETERKAEKARRDFDAANTENASLKQSLKSLQSEFVKCKETLNKEKLDIKTEFELVRKENELLKTKLISLESELIESVKSKEDFTLVLSKANAELNGVKEENKSLKTNVRTLEMNVMGCVKSYKAIGEDAGTEEDKVRVALPPVSESSPSVAREECRTGGEGEAASSSSSGLIEVENASKMASDDATSRYAEIISELNEMNQIIRKRGEKISMLEDLVRRKTKESEELAGKLKEAEQKLSQQDSQTKSVPPSSSPAVSTDQPPPPPASPPSSPPPASASVLQFQDRISALEAENAQLKKSVEGGVGGDSKSLCLAVPHQVESSAVSEVMSTSTVSRVEESQRMREVEDTFEERYMKLKSVALKLKKRLAEQANHLKEVEESKQRVVAEKEELIKRGTVVGAKNIQVLQGEVDRVEDLLEEERKQLKEREKQLVSSAQQAADLKSQVATLQEENGQLALKIKHFESSACERETVIEDLRGKVSSLIEKIETEEGKNRKLGEELRVAEEKMEEEKREREHLMKGFEEAKQDNKKHSLIDLEMKDYERSIEDLTWQVSEKEEALRELQVRLDNGDAKAEALNDEIALLKEQVRSETERAEKLKKTASDYKTQVSDLRVERESRLSEKEKDGRIIETLNQELEKQKLAMSELSAVTSQTESKLRREKEVSENKVDSLEEKLERDAKATHELRTELGNLQKEFEAYKIRAQSVLRQKSKIPQENYEEMKTEKEQLTSDLEVAQMKVHQLLSELTALKAELGFLSSEKERLSLQSSNSLKEASKKEASHQDSLAAWQKKMDDKTAQYQLVISNMSSQTEAMNKSFESQLASEKEKQAREIQKLESKLEETEERIWQMKNTNSPSVPSSGKGKAESGLSEGGVSALAPHHHARKASHGGGGPCPVEEHRIDVTNMIREEGEGSEWVEPTSYRSPSQQLYSPPSLEQLLNSPFPSQPHLPVDETVSVVSAATEFSNKEIAKLESKLSGCEIRLGQVTALLTESEAENAKLVQLSDALKEEIRRASRNESREKHLENNEYMKNVILKFLNLKTGDEKFSLVPVLKTLLQLSPDETSQLAVIAKGDDPQNLPQGWGNYLHLWSGR